MLSHSTLDLYSDTCSGRMQSTCSKCSATVLLTCTDTCSSIMTVTHAAAECTCSSSATVDLQHNALAANAQLQLTCSDTCSSMMQGTCSKCSATVLLTCTLTYGAAECTALAAVPLTVLLTHAATAVMQRSCSSLHLSVEPPEPLDALVKAGVLPSWLGLPPMQHYSGSVQKISDCQRAVLGCHMKADIVCNQRSQKVQLQSGQ